MDQDGPRVDELGLRGRSRMSRRGSLEIASRVLSQPGGTRRDYSYRHHRFAFSVSRARPSLETPAGSSDVPFGARIPRVSGDADGSGCIRGSTSLESVGNYDRHHQPDNYGNCHKKWQTANGSLASTIFRRKTH